MTTPNLPTQPALRPQVCLPPPEPYTGHQPCDTCNGAGITGDRYEFDPNPDAAAGKPLLIVDVICPTCYGCGQGRHATCTPDQHANRFTEDTDDDDDDVGDEEAERACYSCHGRRWWSCSGFSNRAMYELRVPCGCATDLLVPVTAEQVVETAPPT